MEHLLKIDDFRSAPELVQRLYESGIRKTFPGGHVLINENSAIRSVPIVLRGMIKVMRTEEDGREILLYYLRDGESCIMSLLGGLRNEISKVRVEVEEESELLFIPADKIHGFIREYPQWTAYIFRLYHQKFEELLGVINAIAFKRVDERLLNLLRQKAELTNSKILPITHEQLANELGTARVVVSRLLKKLEENGDLTLGRNKITLL
jgi:CRP/FNR family transcriptional regulator